jgi:hypothetical protein
MREDGLIANHVDLGWLADTSSLLAHAETYLNAKAMLGISDRGHSAWLETTLTALAGLDGGTPS